MGEKDLKKDAEKDVEKDAEKSGRVASEGGVTGLRALPVAAWVVICVLAVVLGVLAGHFLLGGPSGVALNGRTALSASELDSTIATYALDGQSTNVTAREVLEEVQGSSDLPANDDGTYTVPAASDVLAYVQNKLILDDAVARGITVSDEELSDYATSTVGTNDFAAIAEQVGLDEEAVKDILTDNVLVTKLEDEVTTVTLPEQPTAPSEPAEGEEDEPTEEYASYVIGLLGDEWDSEANDWARTDGTYYATLSGYEISNDAATYAAASAAYSVAQSAYEDASTQLSEEWGAYTDSLLSRATIQLGSLAE